MDKTVKKQIISAGNLFADISRLIEKSRQYVSVQANSTLTLLFWQIGKRINENILKNKRADYGRQVVITLAGQLTEKYGRSFEVRNLRRMVQFTAQFPDAKIVSTLSTQLSWSHFVELLSIDNVRARLFYAKETLQQKLSIRELRKLISVKTFERTKIANTQLAKKESIIPFDTFKDPYLLDFLRLKDNFLERDIETAILQELEQFILEFGKGFAFVERQKRMIIDGEDFYLDLLFYHRKSKRLVAIELKIGKFQAKYQGQMKLYLKWLNRYER